MSMKAISLFLLAPCLLECVQSQDPLPPILTVYPELEVFTTGDYVTLRCNFTYHGIALYYFYLNDVEIGEENPSDTWSIVSVKPSDSGQYYCIASASGGTLLLMSNIIEFTVEEPVTGSTTTSRPTTTTSPLVPIGSCGLSEFGCCRDQTTNASGPNFQGCPFDDGCTGSEHGCCPDLITPAKGPANLGCPDHICTLEKSKGPCKGQLERFYFNVGISSFKCEKFTYGGCPGNDNNFLTFDQCERVCTKLDYSCEYGEKRYKHGENFTVDCNTCSCSQSVVTCTKKQCADSCPNGPWIRYGDFCITMDFTRRYTYGKAEEKCKETPGASVVTPKTPEQNMYLMKAVKAFKPESFWIGMKAAYHWSNDGRYVHLWYNWMQASTLRLCVRIKPKGDRMRWLPIRCGVMSRALCQIPVKETV